jgi:branched-chain amino acid transport system permease protein
MGMSVSRSSETFRRRDLFLTSSTLGLLAAGLYIAHAFGTEYEIRILINCAIFIALAVSYNLINGVTGQFSLAPNAFAAIGAYTSALLTMSPLEKELSFIIDPVVWPLGVIQTPFLVSLVIAGLVAAFMGFLMGFPVFRVRGDYLAIVTLGFGEVVRVVANNTQSITNGPLGLKGIANYTNLAWSWGFALATIFFIHRLIRSSYGRALKAIRYDESAAEAVGIDTFWHKMFAFIVSAFFGGIGGGLLAHLITTISPNLFTFFLTFNLLIIIVLGGLGSTTGAVIAAVAVTIGSELLRFFEEPLTLGSLHIPGIPGMRMVIFSILLVLLMIFARQGLMGTGEFSWNRAIDGMTALRRRWRGRT